MGLQRRRPPRRHAVRTRTDIHTHTTPLLASLSICLSFFRSLSYPPRRHAVRAYIHADIHIHTYDAAFFCSLPLFCLLACLLACLPVLAFVRSVGRSAGRSFARSFFMLPCCPTARGA